MPWRMMDLRGAKVFARVDAEGRLVSAGGRVEVRYKAASPRAYHAAAANLTPLPGEAAVFPDAHCTLTSEGGAGAGPSAPASPKRKPRSAPRAPESERNPPSSPTGDEVLVYADGACSGNPGPAGLGVVMLWDDQRQELFEFLGTGTNNIAELTAILRACEASPDRARPMRIYTDSNYSIGVLMKNWKAKANRELIQRTREEILKFRDIELLYVRGHHGIVLNERADELAREAITARGTSGWVRST